MFLKLLILCGLYFQQPTLDEANISFEITHMGVLNVEGKFTEIEAELMKVSSNEWRITGEVMVSSVDTDNDSRDETLLTEQYLNAETYPAIPFEGQLLNNGKEILLTIDFEIRGIKAELSGTLYEEEGKLVSEQMILDRSEIGLDFGLMDSLIGDEIGININSGIELGDLGWR